MQPLDITYIHAPATYDFRERSIMYGPVSDMVPSTPIFEMYPLGLTTLCEYLERHGLRARIYNLASMMLHKKNFDVEKNLSRLDSRMFGIDLHWMPHCHGSVEVAKILKRLHPHTPVSFGGLSATIFHEDLIAYDCIDYVVRGDSTEEPMRRLVERIARAQRTGTPVGDLSDIPNLTWKDDTGAVHINPLSWVPDDMNAISLDYAYPMKGVLRHHDMTSYLPMKGWLQYPVTASLTCRGCARNCATCGGSAYTFKNHFGRRRVAWRDPALLIRDIENVQNHVWGPIFVLNDFLQAGEDYTRRFVTGLKGKVHNPIGFEFFGPPPGGDEFYQMLDDNLESWSVEISAESHDDDVRKAFGKGHYKMAELEETIVDALSHPNCERFDLYFMTGIPKQTAASVRETGAYVQHLYERVGYDPRLVVMTSPMAPFLDVGSIVFDNPGKYGYKLRARTFEEHRERMILPSWKHIMNYESVYMSADEMVEATYEAALDINRIKGTNGIIDGAMAAGVDARIRQAREQMRRLDDVLLNGTGRIDARLGALKEEFERLSENTMAEKSELNWAFDVKPTHAEHLAKLWFGNEPANWAAHARGEWRPACSDFPYPDQENGTVAPAWNADGTANCTFKGLVVDGMGDGRALSDDGGAQVAAAGSVVAPGFSLENANEAFAAENAGLEAGRAGTAVHAGEASAIRAEAARTVERDPLLEQMMAEEHEREAAAAASGGTNASVDAGAAGRGLLGRLGRSGGRGGARKPESGLQGAGGAAGARDARRLGKLRRR
ncbi:MAG TPA: TIGR04190 family B12-binding domain/radical SAM domain protein [Candidatus Aphodovivens avistercoris]|nr:TIGR04190 family B12-binding domain/radical SAM domain protein [Candidatus Aphodovivens avistercoris]